MVLNFLKVFQVDGKRKQTNFEDKIKKGEKLHTIRRDENTDGKKVIKYILVQVLEQIITTVSKKVFVQVFNV